MTSFHSPPKFTTIELIASNIILVGRSRAANADADAATAISGKLQMRLLDFGAIAGRFCLHQASNLNLSGEKA